MSSPNSPQNTASPALYDYSPVVASPSLEQQAQNLVSAMEYWNKLVECVWCRDPYYRGRMEELSRLYRCAQRCLRTLDTVIGFSYCQFVPTWVDDFSTYP